MIAVNDATVAMGVSHQGGCLDVDGRSVERSGQRAGSLGTIVFGNVATFAPGSVGPLGATRPSGQLAR
jgi:hypothetical protein